MEFCSCVSHWANACSKYIHTEMYQPEINLKFVKPDLTVAEQIYIYIYILQMLQSFRQHRSDLEQQIAYDYRHVLVQCLCNTVI
jgi:hypothetical protein